jgi:serine/threonine protein kinase
MNLCIDDKWIIFKDKILGKGTYGCIYLTQNKEDCKFYATKMGLWSNKSTIINEINILKQNSKYINIYTHGIKDNYIYYIMDLYGENLSEITNKTPFSLNNIINIALIILKQIIYYHNNNIVHRDIKPNNIVIYNDTFVLIDFGTAININKILCNKNKLYGTIRYMSVKAMEKAPPSFTDDLYSLGYVILFLLCRTLLWSDLYIDYNKKQERTKKIYEIKSTISNFDLVKDFNCNNYKAQLLKQHNKCLCVDKCLAKINLEKYFNYLDNINKNSLKIDYNYIIYLFKKIEKQHNF